jgi:hypothetical protein
MSKKHVLTFLLLTLAILIFCTPVTQNQVRQAARNLCLERNGQANEIAAVEFLNNDAKSHIYVVTLNPGGFILLAGDDASQPVLGYDFNTKWMERELPIQLQDFITSWKEQLAYIIEHNLQADAAIRTEWQRLTVSEAEFVPQRNERAVAPLIASTWGQEGYYNDLCPSNTPVGCVATAMAQIMKYWSFPTVGQGSHTYVHPTYGSQTANFGGTTYNWAGMPNQVGSPNTSVATLGYHAGVAVDMDYDPTGSGAYSSDVPPALINYFKYKNTAILRYKTSYSDANWDALLQGELNNARPIYYAGSGSYGGHAFIIDGFSGTVAPYYYHFNWGWDGYYNGNYYLSNLNPGGYNFTSGQEAVVGIEPSASSVTTLAEGFEGTNFPPSGWTVVNSDGGAYTWVRLSNASYAHTGSASASIQNEAAAHNDWLITPRLTPTTGNYTFSFWSRNYSATYIDRFNVKLSTTTNAVGNFTVSLASNVTPGATYTQFSYNLSAYAGQNVYVAIQAISTNQSYLFVDDVVGPPLYVSPNPTAAINITSWSAGETTPGNMISSGNLFQLSNTGQGILTITSVTNLAATEYKSTINTAVALVPGQVHEFGFTYEPLNYGTDNNQTFQIVTNGGTLNLTLNGSAAYHYFGDGFETYTDFAINFPPWTNTDVDGYTTYGFSGITWTNAYAAQAFIVFNPSATTPAITDAPPYSGNKAAWCWPSTTSPNNDWLITPQLTLTGSSTIKFWARSYFANGYARFKVQYSTTTNATSAFTNYLAGNAGTYISVSSTSWTQYSYTLPTAARYVAIHCVNAVGTGPVTDILMIDNFAIDDQSTAPTPHFGNISGYVYQYGSTTPIANALVAIGTKTATANASGFYQISNLLVGTYGATCTTPGADYFSASASGIAVTNGNTTSQNFYLTWSELAVNVTSFTSNLYLGETEDNILTISNPGGTADLTYDYYLSHYTGAASPRNNIRPELAVPAIENHRIPDMATPESRVAVAGQMYYGNVDDAVYYTDYVTQRATKFTIADFGMWSDSGVTIDSLEAWFYVPDTLPWGTEDTFVFKVYAANGSTVLYTSPVLAAVPSDATYIYPTRFTLPTPLTVDGDFWVAVVPEGTTTGSPYGLSADYSYGCSYYGSAGAWTALGAEEHIISAYVEGNYWVYASGGTGTITPTESENITINFDTADLSVGTYHGLLTVVNNSNYIAPNEGLRGDDLVIPLTLNVMLATYGNVQGHVYYAGTTTPVEGALVSISSWSDFTDANGYYLIEDVATETTDPITATADGFQPYSAAITVLANQTITRNIYLDYSKFSTPQTVFNLTCETGATTSTATTLQNVGNYAVDWTSDSGVWGGDTYLGDPLSVGWEDLNMTGWSGSVGYYSDLYGSESFPYGHNSLVTWVFASDGITEAQYLITPQLSVQSTDNLTFWYKQYNDSSESLNIMVSRTDTNISSFVTIATIGPLTGTDWVQYSRSLSDYEGEVIYVCFYYPRVDAFPNGYFFIDDITGPQVNMPYTEWLSCTPATGTLAASGSAPFTLNANAALLPAGNYTAQTWVFGDATNSPYRLYVNLEVTGLVIPDAPVNLLIAAYDTYVELAWDEVTNANGYHIYACDDPYGDYTEVSYLGGDITAAEISWAELEALGFVGGVSKMFFQVTADSVAPPLRAIQVTSKAKPNLSQPLDRMGRPDKIRVLHKIK